MAATAAAWRMPSMSTPQALRAEQLAALCRQWMRVPLPAVAIGAAVAYLAWEYAPRVLLAGWAVATVGVAAARVLLGWAALLEGRAAAQPDRWSLVLTAMAGANGALAGA